MKGNTYTYGFYNDAIPIKSLCQQGMQKQSGIDQAQDVKIEQNIQNTYNNTTKIEENSAKNEDQDKAINELTKRISEISGVTVDKVDAGLWE